MSARWSFWVGQDARPTSVVRLNTHIAPLGLEGWFYHICYTHGAPLVLWDAAEAIRINLQEGTPCYLRSSCIRKPQQGDMCK